MSGVIAFRLKLLRFSVSLQFVNALLDQMCCWIYYPRLDSLPV